MGLDEDYKVIKVEAEEKKIGKAVAKYIYRL